MTNRGKRRHMGFWSDKILLPLFIIMLKTKRVAKSAISGKINHQIKSVFPYVLGAIIAGWAIFIYLF